MPTQVVPGLEPIVVHAVEQMYPSIKKQKHAFAFLLKHTKESEVLDQLSLVRMGIKNIKIINLSCYLDLNIHEVSATVAVTTPKRSGAPHGQPNCSHI